MKPPRDFDRALLWMVVIVGAALLVLTGIVRLS
jgi:hypothetical protein